MHLGFLGDSVVENLSANAGYTGLIPDPGRSTCRGETRLMCHNYWACAIEPGNHNSWARVLPLLKPACPRVCVPQQEMVVKVAQLCPTLQPHGLYSPWNSPGQNNGVGSLSFLQGFFPTQGLNPGLPYCGWILYQLSHKGSPRKLERVAYPFSRGSSWPRHRTGVSCMAGGFFTNWAMKEAQWEACAVQLKHSPLLLQLEKGPCSNEDPTQPKNIK